MSAVRRDPAGGARRQRPGVPRDTTGGAPRRPVAAPGEDYTSYEWVLLYLTFVVTVLIYFLFTPYTHQLDEIKVGMLASFPPFLLLMALYKTSFRAMTWKTHASTLLLGLYTLVMIVSYLVNPYKAVAERVVWFQFSCSTFTIIYAWFMNSENKMRKTMMFFVLLSLGSVIVGLFLFAGQGFTDTIYQGMKKSNYWSPQAKNLVATLAQAKQMYSTILNEDFYAAYLLMMIPMTLSMFFVEDRLRFKVLAVATFLLMNVCLFFTNSNDSFMSIVLITYPVYFLLGILYVKQWNLSMRMVLVFFGGCAVLAVTVFVLMLPQLSQTWDFKAAALEGRKILWLGGFWPWLYGTDWTMSQIDWKSVIFGTGPGGYRFYFSIFRRPDFFDNQINNVTLYSHNYYIDVLCETGALGLGLFLAFYGRVLYDAVQQIRFTTNKSHRFYQMACVAGLSGIALQNFFSPNNRWAVCGMIYWGLFGLSMGLHHLDNPPEERQPAKQLPSWLEVPTIAKAATVVAALLFLVRSTPQGYWYFMGAMANGKGLIYMDAADAYSGADKQVLLDLSMKNFEKGLKMNPTFVTAYYKLGHVYNQVGNIDKAIETYEKLDSYFPHYSEIHLNLGIMYSVKAEQLPADQRLAMMEKAYVQIKEAARQELKPNVQSIAGMIGERLARLYESRGEKEKALKVYEEIKPYYRTIVEYEPVLEEYRQEKKKHYEEAQQNLLGLATVTGRIKETEKVLATMYREHPDDPSYLSKLMAYYNHDKQTTAKVAFLEKATSEDPVNTRLRKLLADAHAEAGDIEKSYRELRKIEVMAPKDKEALKDLYLICRKNNDEEKAGEYLKKLAAAGVDPQSLTSPTIVAESSTETVAASVTASPARPEKPAPPPQPPPSGADTTATPTRVDRVTTPADTPTTALP